MHEMSGDVRVEEISSVKKKLLFDIPWSNVKKELDSVYKDVGKTARIKGFRPGRTPRNVLEIHYKDQAESQAISNLVDRLYGEALTKNNIVPVVAPVIDQKGIEKDKDFTFSATVEVEPTIDPKGYIGLEIEKSESEITDKDVQARLEELRHIYSTLENIESDRGVIEGDFAYADFEGKVDGKSIKELTQENYLFEIGSKKFYGFEEQIIGVKKGESKEITVKMPDDYPSKEIAGKDVSFLFTVREIKEKVLPELDEDFVKNFERYGSLDDLKQDVKKSLKEEDKIRVDMELTDSIVEKLLEKNNFEVPPAFVERQILAMMMESKRRMVLGGMDPESAAEISSNLYDRFKGEAEKNVKSTYLLGSIANKESITVDDNEVEERLKDFASKSTQNYESLKKSYEEGNKVEYLKVKILEEKTLDFIEGKAKITFVKRDIDKKAGEE